MVFYIFSFFFFQAEDGIRVAQESRGLGDVYKKQAWRKSRKNRKKKKTPRFSKKHRILETLFPFGFQPYILYSIEAADEKKKIKLSRHSVHTKKIKTMHYHT